ncbi:hypothetical protein U8C37_16760 [Sinorhizobium medicae]|uniref:hypothetical protein n=1 Tax=Sinorhizobium medicae TaxID=110321 RepID=UPI002AF6BD27|nr:hypothetical protein [Sinorhizobium medicae]WQO85232.1 hypothetical protein U8C37_16760 [Sinorhizobium medicae]
MPTFKITGPDGKSYRVSGENAEGAFQALQQHLGAAPAPQAESQQSVSARSELSGLTQAAANRGDGFGRNVDSFMRGAADTLSFGLADELGALGGALTGVGGEFRDYSGNLRRERIVQDQRDQQDKVASLAGRITGGVTGGVGLARNGLSMTANAVNRGAGLGRVAATSAVEGGVLGGAHGFGSGEGVEGRVKSGAIGGTTGAALGLAAPLAVAGVSQVGGMAAAPVAARLFPERYAERAIGEGVRRSGMTVDDIAQALTRSQADDQSMFTVADAMGNSGQRMLSTAARTPHNERQAVIEGLQARQAGQGDRLSNFLAEGFGAPDTAAQRAASLAARRSADATTNYGAAREGAGAVNLNNAIGEIDQLLGRDPILGDTALSAGPLGPRLMALRDQLQRDGEQLIDFDRVLNIKSDLFQQMQRNPQVATDMRGVYGTLDEALENASSGYRAANDTFRQQSRTIDAVDTGRNAASGRMRSGDTIPQFQGMTPDEQSAFRAGYVDPLIARVESASMSPTTNKARGLITPKTGEEFPAFALPERADQLGNRVAREQRMFDTANAALGGSKTADNLADAAEMSKFDPGVMSKLVRGDLVGAIMDGGRRLMGEAQGMPPRVVEQVARVLMETNPEAARQLLNGGIGRLSRSDQVRARIIASMISSEAAGTGRINGGSKSAPRVLGQSKRPPLEITITPKR